MSSGHRKTVIYRLGQAAKAQRLRATAHLAAIGLHPGQEVLMKALAEEDGRTMSALATELSVQPPTVTKMVARLSTQGFVSRRVVDSDGRLARVFLTDMGRDRIGEIDRAWKRLEKEAMTGIDDKDRKKLRKLLRQIERNLAQAGLGPDTTRGVDRLEDDEDEPALEPVAG